MLLVKQFDTRKRNEERRKKMEELRLEREKEKERRTETRRMELEILSEMKRPVEDMAVPDPRLVADFFFFVSVYVPRGTNYWEDRCVDSSVHGLITGNYIDIKAKCRQL